MKAADMYIGDHVYLRNHLSEKVDDGEFLRTTTLQRRELLSENSDCCLK